MFACVEGGGTSWVVAICDSNKLINNEENFFINKETFVTTIPSETLNQVKNYLLKYKDQIKSIGICTFGPIDKNKKSPTFGYITSTPKPNWAHTNVLELLGIYDEFKGIPFIFDTDVNAPALSEYSYLKDSSSSSISSCSYVTVGGGIGVGLVVNDQPVTGLMHPEGGHINVKLHPRDTLCLNKSNPCSNQEFCFEMKDIDSIKQCNYFPGVCPFHKNCLEGLCSAKALSQRLGLESHNELVNLPDDHIVWEIFSFYIAQLCANLILLVSVEKIVLGGGVFLRKNLLKLVHQNVLSLLNNYIIHDSITPENIHDLIVTSKW